MTSAESTFLLGPLILLSAKKIPELAVSPGMGRDRTKKSKKLLEMMILSCCFDLVNMSTKAKSILCGRSMRFLPAG
jgi:hypothetical protein